MLIPISVYIAINILRLTNCAPKLGGILFDPVFEESKRYMVEAKPDKQPAKTVVRKQTQPVSKPVESDCHHGYDFDKTICKLINDRLLCGYNKNLGEIDESKPVEVGENCRMIGNRIECGYSSPPFANPRRPPANYGSRSTDQKLKLDTERLDVTLDEDSDSIEITSTKKKEKSVQLTTKRVEVTTDSDFLEADSESNEITSNVKKEKTVKHEVTKSFEVTTSKTSIGTTKTQKTTVAPSKAAKALKSATACVDNGDHIVCYET